MSKNRLDPISTLVSLSKLRTGIKIVYDLAHVCGVSSSFTRPLADAMISLGEAISVLKTRIK